MFLGVSCSKKGTTLQLVNKEINTRLVPETVAKEMAEKFDPAKFLNTGASLSDKKNTSVNGRITSGNKGDENVIQSEVIINDKGGIPALFAFNFKDKRGYVIISADSGMGPVLAYVPKGEFKRGKAPGGAIMWLNKTVNNLERVREGLHTSNKKGTDIAWRSYWSSSTNTIDHSSVSSGKYQVNGLMPPPPPDPCSSDPDYYDAQSTTVGPLLPVEWGQLDSYNDLLTYQNCSISYNGYPPTGCVATAMAQVIRYWQSPVGYNYTSMPLNYGNYYVQTLMKDAGTSVRMQYDCSGSHPPDETWIIDGIVTDSSTALRIASAFTGYFGYGSADYDNYYEKYSDFAMIQNDLANNRPVILAGYSDWNSFLDYPEGDGHVWVCDGYIETNTTFCYNGSSLTETSLVFHMNWGWQETGVVDNFNGWFAYADWSISGTGTGYNYFNELVYNIAP